MQPREGPQVALARGVGRMLERLRRPPRSTSPRSVGARAPRGRSAPSLENGARAAPQLRPRAATPLGLAPLATSRSTRPTPSSPRALGRGRPRLAARVALLRADVEARGASAGAARRGTAPRGRRACGVADPVVDALAHLDPRLLEHVGGADARAERRVHPELEHAREPFALGLEEGGERAFAVASRGAERPRLLGFRRAGGSVGDGRTLAAGRPGRPRGADSTSDAPTPRGGPLRTAREPRAPGGEGGRLRPPWVGSSRSARPRCSRGGTGWRSSSPGSRRRSRSR